jgi:hypothetical protein
VTDEQRITQIESLISELSSLAGTKLPEANPADAGVHHSDQPYSVLPISLNHLSPSSFITVKGIAQRNSNSYTSLSSCCLISDSFIPPKTFFFWECTVYSQKEFYFGFLDQNSDFQTTNSFLVSFPGRTVQSPTIGIINLEGMIDYTSGSTLGAAITDQRILFFMNGKRLTRSIPFPNIEAFTPCFFALDKDITVEPNFGFKKFEVDLSTECLFDLFSGSIPPPLP